MTVEPLVTMVVPFHPARAENGMLETCLWSLRQQDPTPPGGIIVLPVLDAAGAGAAATRQVGLEDAFTEWVGFLDSDDWAYPDHVHTLWSWGVRHSADVVFSYFTVHDSWEAARPDSDPLLTFGKPFDPAMPHQTTGTILVRRRTLADAGIGWKTQPDGPLIPGTALRYGEDWDLTLQCVEKGLKILHVPRRTWAWRIGGHNTSGLPGRGDAAQQRRESE